ncbi:MAG: cupin [Rhizobiaceae bacterium]|nr:cupin [Rhizobiaceae bacterium]
MALKHAEPGEVIDLSQLGPELNTAKTAALVKTDAFEAVRLVVRKGISIPTHSVPGQIMLHCLEGHVVIGLKHGEATLQTNEWLYLNGGEPHSVHGLEDSSLLLTILFTR